MLKGVISCIVCLSFILSGLPVSYSQLASPSGGPAGDLILPEPGKMVALSQPFNPPMLKGIKVHDDNPFFFDFVLDQGDAGSGSPIKKFGGDRETLKQESTKLIKYFLASLTIPENDLWVNLSPYEKDRIIPPSFGLTQMGRDLLAQDYMLKQVTASLIYPEGVVGKKFWARVYAQAIQKYHTTNIPVNTFNKVWIIPDKALVYENAKVHAAYVGESKLKVMLEEDYLSLSKHVSLRETSEGPHAGHSQLLASDEAIFKRTKIASLPAVARSSYRTLAIARNDMGTNTLGSQILREIVIPELTQEVNANKNFAPLRQVYNSLILATWYKKKIKDSVFAQVYANKAKIAGVNINDPREKQKIYERYLMAFKKGVYNYIKEERDEALQQIVPRKYFSGGEIFWGLGEKLQIKDAAMMPPLDRREALGLGLLFIAGCLAEPTAPNPTRSPDAGTSMGRPQPTRETLLNGYKSLDPRTGQSYYNEETGTFYDKERRLTLNAPLAKNRADNLLRDAEQDLSSDNEETRRLGNDLKRTVYRQLYATSAESEALWALAVGGEEGVDTLLNSFLKDRAPRSPNMPQTVDFQGGGDVHGVYDTIQLRGFSNPDVSRLLDHRISSKSSSWIGLAAVLLYFQTSKGDPLRNTELLTLAKERAEFIQSLVDPTDGAIIDGKDQAGYPEVSKTKTTAYNMAALYLLDNLARAMHLIGNERKAIEYKGTADRIYAWLKNTMFSQNDQVFYAESKLVDGSWVRTPVAQRFDPRTMDIPVERIKKDPTFMVSGRTGEDAVSAIWNNMSDRFGIFETTPDGTRQIKSFHFIVPSPEKQLSSIVWALRMAAKFKQHLSHIDGYTDKIRLLLEGVDKNFVPDASGRFLNAPMAVFYPNGKPAEFEETGLRPTDPSAPFTPSVDKTTYGNYLDANIFRVLVQETAPDPMRLVNQAMTTAQSQAPVMATTNKAQISPTGGIDLTAGNMNLQTMISGSAKGGIKFHLNQAMLTQLQKSPGFKPTIVSVQPLKSVQEFLELT